MASYVNFEKTQRINSLERARITCLGKYNIKERNKLILETYNKKNKKLDRLISNMSLR